MAGNYVLDGFKDIGKDIGKFWGDNKAHILTGLSVTGTVATCVLSARSGARSARKIDRREQELGRRLSRGEKLKLCGKDFIAPAVSSALAIFGSVGSDVINTQAIARANMALVVSERAYEALNRKTKEVLGEKKAQQIKDEVVKEKVEEVRKQGYLSQSDFDNAPRSGNGQLRPFVDGYSMLPMWSTMDYIALQVKEMNSMMHEIKNRDDRYDYSGKCIGIPYSEWLRRMNFDTHMWSTSERKNHGWNRGYDKDGVDDDPIEYYTHPMEWEPGFAVTVIDWVTDPSDMKLGHLKKQYSL